MSKAFNIIVFLVCLGFVYYLVGQSAVGVIDSNASAWFANFSGTNGGPDQFYGLMPFRVDTTTATAAIVTTGLAVGTVFFPNPYTLFALAASSLATFYFGTRDLTNFVGMPAEIQGLFTILGFIFVIAVLMWYKGNE